MVSVMQFKAAIFLHDLLWQYVTFIDMVDVTVDRPLVLWIGNERLPTMVPSIFQ